MKIALISDIHSNLEALESVLREIEKQKPDKIVCLGDVVGYGANPNECCELVRRYCDICLLGNHDAAVCGKTDTSYFVEHARISAEWTKRELSDENIEWLSSLPYTWSFENLLFSHSAPHSPEEWIYLVDVDTAWWVIRYIKSLGMKACFVGHAHITWFFATTKDGRFAVENKQKFHLDEYDTLAINVGSVGQPRDRDPRAAFSILEDGEYKVFRVEYDIETASRKIVQAGLPEILAQRLFVGR